MYIIGIVIFGLLVSGDLQPWAIADDDDDNPRAEDDEKGGIEKQPEGQEDSAPKTSEAKRDD